MEENDAKIDVRIMILQLLCHLVQPMCSLSLSKLPTRPLRWLRQTPAWPLVAKVRVLLGFVVTFHPFVYCAGRVSVEAEIATREHDLKQLDLVSACCIYYTR
jgi:hypothetical protein